MTSYVLATGGALATALTLNRVTRVICFDACFMKSISIISVFLAPIEIESVDRTFGSIDGSSSGKLHKHSDDEKFVSGFSFFFLSIVHFFATRKKSKYIINFDSFYFPY